MNTIIYDDDISTLNLIFEEYPKGSLLVVCPVCKTELLVILDAKGVATHKLAPGIYCKNNHIRSLFNFRGKHVAPLQDELGSKKDA